MQSEQRHSVTPWERKEITVHVGPFTVKSAHESTYSVPDAALKVHYDDGEKAFLLMTEVGHLHSPDCITLN
jgi:hypothetical protein